MERMKQILTSDVELKAGEDGELTGEVKAVIATLDVIDHHGDVLLPGAVGKQDVAVSAYNHGSWPSFSGNGALPIGKGVIREAKNQHGKHVIFEGQLFMDDPEAARTMRLLKNMGGTQEWSFSLHDVKGGISQRDGRDVYEIKSVSVKEVSPVLKGASIGSRTVAVKAAAGDVEKLRQDLDAERVKVANLEKQLAEARNAHANDLYLQEVGK